MKQGDLASAEEINLEGLRLRPRSVERIEAYADFLSDLGLQKKAAIYYSRAKSFGMQRSTTGERSERSERTESYNVTYVSQDDVDIVIGRIPAEERTRLRDVFISARHHGVRRLGSVRIRGRRDINLFAILPPRVSLRRYMWRQGRQALQYGAPARGQWPPWAVRRFLLYDVFLHELGHLQLVLPQSSDWKRKYASEKIAQDFANEWRTKLWSNRYDHPDPIHNPPQEDEIETIGLWEQLDKGQRYLLVDLALRAPHEDLPDLTPFGEITELQQVFLSRAFCQKSE